MKKFLLYTDKVFRIVVAILGIAIVIFLIGTILMGVTSLIRFLVYNLAYISIVVIVIFLILLHYKIGKYELLEQLRSIERVPRVVATTIGFILITVLYFNPEFGRYYSAGEYCAKVSIINHKTDKITSTKLLIEVEDGIVSVIYFNNGGWLDTTHFNPEDAVIDNNGWAFFADDRDREFDVEIINRGNCD